MVNNPVVVCLRNRDARERVFFKKCGDKINLCLRLSLLFLFFKGGDLTFTHNI